MANLIPPRQIVTFPRPGLSDLLETLGPATDLDEGPIYGDYDEKETVLYFRQCLERSIGDDSWGIPNFETVVAPLVQQLIDEPRFRTVPVLAILIPMILLSTEHADRFLLTVARRAPFWCHLRFTEVESVISDEYPIGYGPLATPLAYALDCGMPHLAGYLLSLVNGQPAYARSSSNSRATFALVLSLISSNPSRFVWPLDGRPMPTDIMSEFTVYSPQHGLYLKPAYRPRRGLLDYSSELRWEALLYYSDELFVALQKTVVSQAGNSAAADFWVPMEGGMTAERPSPLNRFCRGQTVFRMLCDLREYEQYVGGAASLLVINRMRPRERGLPSEPVTTLRGTVLASCLEYISRVQRREQVRADDGNDYMPVVSWVFTSLFELGSSSDGPRMTDSAYVELVVAVHHIVPKGDFLTHLAPLVTREIATAMTPKDRRSIIESAIDYGRLLDDDEVLFYDGLDMDVWAIPFAKKAW